MKIKVKKQMNLHELIKWAWDNDVVKKGFLGTNDCTVSFGRNGEVHVDLATRSETFEVEVKEEITEETVISMLLEVCEYRDGSFIAGLRRECSIKGALYNNELMGITTHAFYMLNDDASLTSIWKDGEMVE